MSSSELSMRPKPRPNELQEAPHQEVSNTFGGPLIFCDCFPTSGIRERSPQRPAPGLETAGCGPPGKQDEMAISIHWGSFLWESLSQEHYSVWLILQSICGPVVFGNLQMASGNSWYRSWQYNF